MSMTGRFRQVLDTVEQKAPRRPDGHVRRRVRWLLYVARLFMQVVRQWVRDRCPQQAAALAFQGSLSAVPIIAIGLALLRALGAFREESTLVEHLSRQVLPISRDEISKHLVEWAGHLNFKTTGVPGVIMALALSFIMFNSVERIFNDIWRVEKRRSFGSKFVVFYAIATIVPLLLGVSLYHMAAYGLTRGFIGFFGGVGATWGALFLANKLLPATRVKWSAAAIGALLSSVLFELAKVVFQVYVAKVAFRKYSGVYGTLGLIPILLVWIYYSWMVILLGAEVSHAIQHLRSVEQSPRHDGDPLEHVNGVTAARVLAAIVTAWRGGGGGIETEALADRLELPDVAVERMCRRLEWGHLIVEGEKSGGFVPARPPSAITLADVFALYDPIDGPLRERAASITLEELASPASAPPQALG
jgi:membrane protein